MTSYKFNNSANLSTIEDSDKRYLFFELNGISYGVGVDSCGVYVGYYKDRNDYDQDKVDELIKLGKFDKRRYDYLTRKASLNAEATLGNIAENKDIDIAKEAVKKFCDIMAKHLR